MQCYLAQELAIMDYVKYYAGPLISLVGIAGFLLGGNWVWLGVLTFPAITLLDSVLPRDLHIRRITSPLWAAVPVWLGALAPVIIFVAFAWRLSVETLSIGQIVGGTLSCGWLALVPGIAAQHELFHSRGRIARTIGRYAQFTLLDGMRDVEHVVYHHLDVSTPIDISTAPRGTSIYRYTPRTVYEVVRVSLKAESDALQKRGFSRWNYKHRAWKILVIQIIYQSIIYAIGGWVAVLCTLAAMTMARIWVEMFSYFQHYGQTRIPGTPIGRRHVWNHMGAVTRLVGFELTNHADHHLDPYAPYYKLRPHREAIPMPSIFVCFLAALIPPIWDEMIIKPALKRWDLEFATPAEREVARQQNIAAGWEDWFDQQPNGSAQLPATVAC
jgi:p-cymene monooxygenase